MIKTPSAEEKLNAIICDARAVLEKHSFAEAAREIFDRCCEITGAVSGYVAMLSPDGHGKQSQAGLWAGDL